MFSGISPLSVLIILLIVVLLFGTKKLRGLGGDLGSAIKSFRKAMKDETGNDNDIDEKDSGRVIDVESSKESTK